MDKRSFLFFLMSESLKVRFANVERILMSMHNISVDNNKVIAQIYILL